MRILIVDDNEDTRVLQERVLAAQGYTVESATDGMQALEMARRSRPDIIISDILMPKMDGFKLCHAVKSDEQLRTVPFVFYSASYTRSKDKELAMAMGASRYIAKATDIEDFLKTIEEILKEHREGKLEVPEQPKLGEKELERMHGKVLVEQLGKKVQELEKKHKALTESELQVTRQAAVMEGINKVFREALTCETEKEVAKTCLAVAQELVNSKFSFYGEINPAGFFDITGMSDPGWDACRIPDSDAVVMITDMKIHGIYGSVLKGEESQIVNDPASHPDRVGFPEGHPPLKCFLGVPLKRGDKTIGMIALANKESGYTVDDQHVIEALSVAYVEAIAHKRAEEALHKTLEGTIQALATTVETRDPYTAGHQQRVTDLARAIATQMGCSTECIHGISMAGIIHDVGKIGVPAEILSKPGKITSTEYEIIKTHSQAGYDILKDIKFPWPVAEIVLQHQERMDGSGYPKGLSGDDILMEARIIAIADVVEAMSSHRPYRAALGIDKALEEINEKKGIFYDSNVVDACTRLFKEKGFELKTGGLM